MEEVDGPEGDRPWFLLNRLCTPSHSSLLLPRWTVLWTDQDVDSDGPSYPLHPFKERKRSGVKGVNISLHCHSLRKIKVPRYSKRFKITYDPLETAERTNKDGTKPLHPYLNPLKERRELADYIHCYNMQESTTNGSRLYMTYLVLYYIPLFSVKTRDRPVRPPNTGDYHFRL